jgi:hypothetical protein
VTKVNCPVLLTPSSVASYHPPSIEVCSNHIYHSNLRVVETERHDGVTWQPNHSIPKNRENSFLPEGTGLTLLPLYTHPSVTPYKSNTPVLLYYGRTVYTS